MVMTGVAAYRMPPSEEVACSSPNVWNTKKPIGYRAANSRIGTGGNLRLPRRTRPKRTGSDRTAKDTANRQARMSTGPADSSAILANKKENPIITAFSTALR